MNWATLVQRKRTACKGGLPNLTDRAPRPPACGGKSNSLVKRKDGR